MLQTISHQTLEDRDNADHIEDYGPFPVGNVDQSYLGYGYYFWDDHIELAHWWGKVHCAGNYVICQGDFDVPSEIYYDLVGNRRDQINFSELISELNLDKLPLGQIIEVLKDLESKPNTKGIFPYQVIRAVDKHENTYKQEIYKFADNREGETTLSPMIVICLVKKNPLLLHSYKIIYPEEYVQD